VANTQLFVRNQELHTLKVTGQGMVTQIEARVASLEGIALEDQDEAILSHCGVEALSTQEVAGRILGGKAHGSLTHKDRYNMILLVGGIG
ncbi:hypothetical protein K5549_021465, partial [Capra hircus]